jgi:hypothetical protein
MRKLWAVLVAMIAAAFWFDSQGSPMDDDPTRFREGGLL